MKKVNVGEECFVHISTKISSLDPCFSLLFAHMLYSMSCVLLELRNWSDFHFLWLANQDNQEDNKAAI